MDRPVLIVEAPEMDDDNIAKMQDFLYELIRAFEGHYYVQLNRGERKKEAPVLCFDELDEGEYPFLTDK